MGGRGAATVPNFFLCMFFGQLLSLCRLVGGFSKKMKDFGRWVNGDECDTYMVWETVAECKSIGKGWSTKQMNKCENNPTRRQKHMGICKECIAKAQALGPPDDYIEKRWCKMPLWQRENFGNKEGDSVDRWFNRMERALAPQGPARAGKEKDE